MLTTLGQPGLAWAIGDAEDGVYGRLDGDLSLGLDVGVSEAFPGESIAGRLTTAYLHSAAVYAQYNDSFGLQSQPTARSLGSGVELRPLFLVRFGGDMEQGPATLDLLLDSLAVGLGIYGTALPAAQCAGTGLDCWRTGLELGAGLELPLLPEIAGPFIAVRGCWRWPTSSRPVEPTVIDSPGGMLTLSIGYRLVVMTHLVDARDAR
jgi:hypothetical protein